MHMLQNHAAPGLLEVIPPSPPPPPPSQDLMRTLCTDPGGAQRGKKAGQDATGRGNEAGSTSPHPSPAPIPSPLSAAVQTNQPQG